MFSNNFIYFSSILVCLLVSFVVCQTNISTESSNNSTVSTTSVTTSTKNITCEQHDNDCKACVAYSECYFCGTDNKCHFKFTKILTDDECSFKEIYYLTCRVNFQYLMIGIGVLGLIVFLIITIFCCYCCCKRKGMKVSKDDLKWSRKREERKQIALEKRQERAERTEEIRKKYGLVKDSNPYQRFDA